MAGLAAADAGAALGVLAIIIVEAVLGRLNEEPQFCIIIGPERRRLGTTVAAVVLAVGAAATEEVEVAKLVAETAVEEAEKVLRCSKEAGLEDRIRHVMIPGMIEEDDGRPGARRPLETQIRDARVSQRAHEVGVHLAGDGRHAERLHLRGVALPACQGRRRCRGHPERHRPDLG